MALSKTGLRDRIKSKVEAATGNTMPALSLSIWEAIAEAIIEEIQANGTISVTTTTSCPAGAGTGSGSGTIS